jgi:spore coat polysaccharide biosynthesis protein SpsF
MKTNHIGAIIPVRLASERLPGKALKEICGRPALYHLLDRTCASRFVGSEDVVVCTTADSSDDPLVAAVERYGCSVFRGSTDDIIRRFHDAVTKHSFDAVIQVDGDDILCDTEYMDLTMEALLNDSALDIVTCEGLPLGVASKSFTRRALERVFRHYRTERNDTGFTYFFTRTGLCRQAVLKPRSDAHVIEKARLTLDYEEDLEVFRRILEALYVPGGAPATLVDVVSFLRAHPEVANMNLALEGQYWARTREKAQLAFANDRGVVEVIE